VSAVSGSDGADAAGGRSANDQGLEVMQASQRNVDGLLGSGLDTPFQSYASEPAVDDDVDTDEGDTEATHVSVSGGKRSLSASEAVERQRKRYHHNLYSD
jgi:hypothetical protein